jgi:hypothetical protein
MLQRHRQNAGMRWRMAENTQKHVRHLRCIIGTSSGNMLVCKSPVGVTVMLSCN